MFHWICPECGREIAPTAKECAACDPSATSVETAPAAAPEPPAAPMVLTPEIVAAPAPVPVPTHLLAPEPLLLSAPRPPVALLSPAPLLEVPAEPKPEPAMQPRMPHIPRPKAAFTNPAASPATVSAQPMPTAAEAVELPVHASKIQDPEPSVAAELPHAPLREPQPRRLLGEKDSIPGSAIEPLPVQWTTQLPSLGSPVMAEPLFAAPVRTAATAMSTIRPAKGDLSLASAEPREQISLPGPTLPFELTSLKAAGIQKMLPLNGQMQSLRKSGTFVSIAVASGFLAVAIAGVFYAMPTLARSSSEEPKAVQRPVPVTTVSKPIPVAVAHKAPAELEVTGVRFVTDLPDRPPQIHYLVVNHTNGSLSGVVVNVTLRAAGNQPPLSQFSFRSPRLAPYESKEMVSSIERLNRPLETPDWRDVQAEIEYQQ